MQIIAKSPALDEYVLKMPLDIQNGSLGAEDEHFRKRDKWPARLATSDTDSVIPPTKTVANPTLNKNETI